MGKYFDSNGYFLADSLFTDRQPFIFVLGGRGTGKTYSATRWLCNNCSCEHKFIFMRRTDNEIQFINAGNIYEEHSPDITLNTKKQKIAQVIRTDDLGNDECIGYHVALSTIHNIRGFSMLDVDYILFDEFIAERGTVIRKFAGEQMLNAYETINRNRELKGQNPVKCIFLSNFNTAESDIMSSFGFTDELYTLQNATPIGICEDDLKRLIMINESPISEAKSKTVLYQVTSDENFQSMAINNDGTIFIMPIKHYGRNCYEYLGTIGEVNINRLHSGYYYLTQSNKPHEVIPKDLIKYFKVYRSHLLGNVYASNQYVAQQFVNLFN